MRQGTSSRTWIDIRTELVRSFFGGALSGLALIMAFEQAAWAGSDLPRLQQTPLAAQESPAFGLTPSGKGAHVFEQWSGSGLARYMTGAEGTHQAVANVTPPATVPGDQASIPIGPDPGQGYVRLPGHVLPGLENAAPAPFEGVPLSPYALAAQERMTLTVVLQREDQAGFDRYYAEVYDPHAKRYRHFLTQAQLANRYGPARTSYRQVLGWLHGQGFKLIEGSKNRLTLTVSGTRAQVEQAFSTRISDYSFGGAQFFANDRDPAVPLPIAQHVAVIGGLSAAAPPQAAIIANNVCGTKNYGDPKKKQQIDVCRAKVMLAVYNYGFCGLAGFAGLAGPFTIPATAFFGVLCALFGALNLLDQLNGIKPKSALLEGSAAAGSTSSAGGTGQTIGLLEFDSFNSGDVSDFLTLIGASSTQIGNLSVKAVNGGVAAVGSGESEVLLDIDTVMALAPGAKVVAYEIPFTGQASNYTAAFNAMINDGVTVISNSWASCEDQVSQADAQSIDTVLQTAAASGISVFNGSGDSGGTCLDGAASTITVPADSPNATAVGGSSLPNGLGPALTYNGEVWWDGAGSTPVTGQGGYGVSRYFTRPGYQDGISGATMRSIPDVVTGADPALGTIICQADNGGCPDGLLNGGTSLAAPEWAAIAALLNQAQGKNLGFLNKLLYPLAATDAFNSAASMGSDFAHVGLGSPNPNVLHRRLNNQTAGTPDAGVSQVIPLAQSGTAVVHADLSVSVPADGTSQGGVRVTLFDANGNTVSGKSVTLSPSGGSATVTPSSAVTTVTDGAAIFTVTDLTPETVTFTAADATDGVSLTQTAAVTFGVPPASGASLNVFPTSVAADGSSSTTLTVVLKDALGRPTPGKQINVSQGGGHSVVNGPSPSLTDGNGQIQFNATDDINETVTYTAVDATDGNLPIPGSGTPVTFSNAGASDCTANPATAASGYALTTFASGFPGSDFFYSNINFGGCPGAVNPYFDGSGVVLVPDFKTGDIYQLGAGGGAVTSGNVLANLGPSIGTPVYGKDGSLYAARFATGGGFTTGDIVQLNPASGAIVRELATGLTCPNGLSVDPLSGDLFFDDQCFGGGSDNPSLWRLSNPSGTNPTVSVYATLPGSGGQQQIAFSPDGTLYVVSGGGGNPQSVVQVGGTNKPAPATVKVVQGLVPDNGSIAIGKTNADGSAKTLLLHVGGSNGGTLETFDISASTPAVDIVLATGDIGAGSIGPDGCYYVGTHHLVYKLAPSSGNCGLTPTSPGPALALSPSAVATNPLQGSPLTLTATLSNATPLSGVPVYFQVSGANPQIRLVRTDTTGHAAFTYAAVNPGNDTIVATTSVANPAAQQKTMLHSRPFAMRPPVEGSNPAFAGFESDAPPAGTRFPAVHPTVRSMEQTRAKPVVRGSAAAAATIELLSNPAQISWAAGPHATLLTLNPSPTSGTPGQMVTVVAALTDVSADPIAVLANQVVDFALGSATCRGSTDSTGLARCALTPDPLAGAATLTATFAGTSQFAASTAVVGFNTLTAPSSGSSSSGGGSSSGGSGSGGSSSGGSGSGGGGAMTTEGLAFGALAFCLRRRRKRAANSR